MSIDIRQDLVAKLLVENPGMSRKTAMIKAGYSESYAEHGSKELIQNPNFRKFLDARLPDKGISKDVSKKIKEGLNATTKKPHLVDRDDKGRPVYDYVDETDFDTRHKYIDTVIKLKGAYAPVKQENVNTNLSVNELIDKMERDRMSGYQPNENNNDARG